MPTYDIVSFQHRERQDTADQSRDFFYMPHVSSSQCVFETEGYSEGGIKIDYCEHKHRQAYGTISSFLRLSSETTFLMIIYH